MSLLIEIDRFLRRSGISATGFGRQAMGDPRFVSDLRRGRVPGRRVRQRARAFIAARDKGQAECE